MEQSVIFFLRRKFLVVQERYSDVQASFTDSEESEQGNITVPQGNERRISSVITLFSTQPSLRRPPESKRPVRETLAKPVVVEESEEYDIEILPDTSVAEERRDETTLPADEEMEEALL